MTEAITVKLTRKEARLARLQARYDQLLRLAAANERAGDHDHLRTALRMRIDAIATKRQIEFLGGGQADLTRDAECLLACARRYLLPE